MELELDYYVRLIPSHNRQKPIFRQVVQAMCAGPWNVRRSMKGWDFHFQLETAIGNQLDILGEWIGANRWMQIEVDGIFFTWDDAAPELGWQEGVWQGRFDSNTNLAALGDEDYRRLLYTLIMYNQWDGSAEQLHAIWSRFLPEGTLAFVQDNQDMTITIGYVSGELTGLNEALARMGALLIKPMAVRIREFVYPPDGLYLLTWDAGPYFYDPQWRQKLLSMGYWCDHAVLTADDILVAGPAPFTGWLYGNFPLTHSLTP